MILGLHYTTLHFIVVYTGCCNALNCTTLHCTALHGTALHCTALHCTALHRTALHCTAPYCELLIVDITVHLQICSCCSLIDSVRGRTGQFGHDWVVGGGQGILKLQVHTSYFPYRFLPTLPLTLLSFLYNILKFVFFMLTNLA